MEGLALLAFSTEMTKVLSCSTTMLFVRCIGYRGSRKKSPVYCSSSHVRRLHSSSSRDGGVYRVFYGIKQRGNLNTPPPPTHLEFVDSFGGKGARRYYV